MGMWEGMGAEKDTWGGQDGNSQRKNWNMQDQEGGSARQRDHRPVCDGKVIGPQTQLHRGRFQQS